MSIFLVTFTGNAPEGKPRTVEARTAKSAIAHVAADSFEARALTMREIVAMTKDGIEIEDVAKKGDPE